VNAKIQSSSLKEDPRYQRVLKILERLRGRALRACFFSGIGRLLVFLLASISIRCLLDYWLQFAWGARVALLVTDLLILGWIGAHYLFRPLSVRFDRSVAALRLQAHAPELRSSVIATIQLVPKADAGTAPRSLVARLLDQTAGALGELDWKRAVALKSGSRWLLVAGVLGGSLIGWGLAFPDASSVLVARYFLSTRPPIQDTQIAVLSGDVKVPRGGQVDLVAELSGVLPDEVGFFLDDGSGTEEEIRVGPEASAADRFSLPVENLQETFTYQITGGDARSSVFTVEVLDPPVLEELTFQVTPPPYTGIEPYRLPAGELRVIEGAKVELEGQSTLELEQAIARLHGVSEGNGDTGQPEWLEQNLSVDGNRILGDLGRPGRGVSSISVKLRGVEGIDSVDNTRHTIEWVLDNVPEIAIQAAPEDESTVVFGRPVMIEGQVSDDYAVTKLQFVWSMADREASNSFPVTLDGSGRFTFRFIPGRRGSGDGNNLLESTPGDVINWKLKAEDNSGLARGPQTAESSIQRLVVVTAEEKIAELLERVSENISTIETASERQEEAGIRLRRLMEMDKLQKERVGGENEKR
jgi:hypothetical protein